MRHRLHTTRALLLAALLFAGSPALAQTNATAGQDAPPSTTAGATNNTTSGATNNATANKAQHTAGATPKPETTPEPKREKTRKTAAAKETTIPGGALAFAAYFILWLLLFGVVASTLMQQRALVGELKDLERKMDDAFGLSDDA